MTPAQIAKLRASKAFKDLQKITDDLARKGITMTITPGRTREEKPESAIEERSE